MGPNAISKMAMRVEAKDALVRLGWKTAIATAAVDAAIADVGAVPIEELLRAALRRCPRPTS